MTQHVHNPTLPCSCYIQHRSWGLGPKGELGESESIVYCPTHAAAPEMLELIQRLAKAVVGHGCVPLEGNYKRPEDGFIGQARALLAKIEGGK